MTPTQLLSFWYWINYFGINLSTESTREYIYSVVDQVDTISMVKDNDIEVIMAKYDDGKASYFTKLSSKQITILTQIINNFSGIESLCTDDCRDECKCVFECSDTKTQAVIMRVVLCIHPFTIQVNDDEGSNHRILRLSKESYNILY